MCGGWGNPISVQDALGMLIRASASLLHRSFSPAPAKVVKVEWPPWPSWPTPAIIHHKRSVPRQACSMQHVAVAVAVVACHRHIFNVDQCKFLHRSKVANNSLRSLHCGQSDVDSGSRIIIKFDINNIPSCPSHPPYSFLLPLCLLLINKRRGCLFGFGLPMARGA